MSRRRALTGACATLLAPLSGCFVFADSAPVVGFISMRQEDSQAAASNLESLRQGLREQGFVDGDSVVIEPRYADGHIERVPGLAQELIDRGAAVLAVATRDGARAVQGLTSAVPIVFAQATGVSEGAAVPDAAPGANLTGVANISDLDPRRLQLLDALVPPGGRIAYVSDPTLGTYERNLAETQQEAERLHRPLMPVRVGNDTEMAMAYKKLSGKDVGGLIVSSARGLRGRTDQVVALAARRHLPAIYFDRSFVDGGGLMSYGASFGEVYRQAGIYVGRILHGAQPRSLPVLDPHAAELVINIATAKAQGIAFPPAQFAGATVVGG